jgi:(1->4)-alpha-D-glucan 1-alpha-D-glucosylmutase
VRMERDDVFELVHGKVLELVRDGVVDGLRVDHPDGLADPAGYLRRLRDASAGHVWVEKILHPGEALRDWAVDGTVGYEFLNDACAVFVEPVLGGDAFEAVAYEAQLEQARGTFSREVEWLQSLCDVPGIPETLAALPIYRTYVEPWSGRVEDADRAAIDAASPPDELRRVLLLEEDGFDEFVTRFQQTSPPVTAKGVEDTAFYRYNRLLALNEVGGDPSRLGISVDEFHRANAARRPGGLLTLSTHDTKRSADVRARLAALTWIWDEWQEHLRAMRAARPWEDEPEFQLVHQTLVGAWPISGERLDAYFSKALREAKVHTNWVDQDHDYEARVQRYAREAAPDAETFARRLAPLGERVALGQALLMLTSPGIPAIYQGDELWALSLVDPDNRRPVDWDERRRALQELHSGAAPTRETAKLFLTWKALDLRARRPEAFTGVYTPLDAPGGVVAYERGGAVRVFVAVRERGRVPDPDAGWTDVLGGALPGVALLERS